MRDAQALRFGIRALLLVLLPADFRRLTKQEGSEQGEISPSECFGQEGYSSVFLHSDKHPPILKGTFILNIQ